MEATIKVENTRKFVPYVIEFNINTLEEHRAFNRFMTRGIDRLKQMGGIGVLSKSDIDLGNLIEKIKESDSFKNNKGTWTSIIPDV